MLNVFREVLKGLGVSNPVELMRFIKCETNLMFLQSPFPKGDLLLFLFPFRNEHTNVISVAPN